MGVFNQEWLDSNMQRAFPFREDSSLQDGMQAATLPNYVLVDAVFGLAQGQLSEQAVYLDKLVFTGDYLTLYFSGTLDLATVAGSLGSVSIRIADSTIYASYRLSGADDYYEDANCRIVVGDLSRLSSDLAPGVYLFNWTSAAMEPHVVRPSLRAVRALQTQTDGQLSEYVRGHVVLVAGNNMRITAVDSSTLRFDAIATEGLYDACVCDGSFPVYPPIRTINGIPPDASGNIVLEAGDCIAINGGSGSLSIQDTCSVPCCGCDELKAIVDSMAVAESAIGRLTSNIDRLSEKQAAFYNAVIMSLM